MIFSCFAVTLTGKIFDFGVIEASTERQAKLVASNLFVGNYTLYLENDEVIFAKTFFYGTWSKLYK